MLGEGDVAELELGDGVVALRRWRRADGPALVAIWQDPELQRRFGVEPPVTDESIDAYLDGVDDRWATGVQVSLAVVAGDEIVGGCDLDDLDTDEPDLGYWTAAAHRGRGLATRAARLLVEWAMPRLDGDQALHLVVEPDNAASIAVATRLGFRRVEDRQEVEDGRALDVYVLGPTV